MPSVVFSLATLQPHVGGAETYIRSLVSEYRRLAPFPIHVLVSRDSFPRYREMGGGAVEVHELEHFVVSGRIRRAFTFGRALVRREQPSLPMAAEAVITHYPITVPIPRVPGARVVTLHDVRHHDSPRDFAAWQRCYRSIAYDRTTRRSAHVITVSEHARTRLIETLSLDPARVHAIHHGIDHGRFRPAAREPDAQVLAPYELPERFILYPANLWPHKNHDNLIKALARVADQSLHLVLTGQTFAHGSMVAATAARAGVSDRVIHLGHVPREVVPALYRRSLALVFPSRYEGFGAPPLEAMACGCPVAAGRSTAVEEVCGSAALLFDPNDVDGMARATEMITEDETLRTDLRERGYARAQAFSWEAAARRHLDVYALAAAETPGG
jgi:glycosyltransferase involved in cell wall biosynthesis